VSEEVSAPASAPAVESAAPASAPTSAPASTSSVESAQTSIHPAQNAASGQDVDWDSWNGDVRTLPESVRRQAEHINRWYQNDYDGRRREMDDLKAVYTAMLNEDEDPRVGKLTTELEEMRGNLDGRNTEYEDLESRFNDMSELAVRDYVDQFWRQHSDLRENEEKLAKFGPLLQESNEFGGSWDGYIAAQLIELPEDAIAIAVDAKKNGVSDEYAFKLAESHARLSEREGMEEAAKAEVVKEVKKAASKPRPAAKITNGATGSTRPQAAKRGMKEAKTLDEMRDLAARRALRVHSGGR